MRKQNQDKPKLEQKQKTKNQIPALHSEIADNDNY